MSDNPEIIRSYEFVQSWWSDLLDSEVRIWRVQSRHGGSRDELWVQVVDASATGGEPPMDQILNRAADIAVLFPGCTYRVRFWDIPRAEGDTRDVGILWAEAVAARYLETR